jgi:hypothetical protein
MRIEIQVMETETGKVFTHANRSFNIIEGVWELIGNCSLTIYRSGAVFDRTDCITTCGAHDEGTAFRDLHVLAQETWLPNGSGASVLTPHHFKIGDVIVIETTKDLSAFALDRLMHIDDRESQAMLEDITKKFKNS